MKAARSSGRGHGPRGVTERDVVDTPLGESRHERARSRYPDHLHAFCGKGAELGAEEEGQADVRRRDVYESLAFEVDHPRPRARRR